MGSDFTQHGNHDLTANGTMIAELKFLRRDKAALLWLSLAFILSVAAVALGLREVQSQNAQISELIKLDKVEQDVVLSEQSDWGGLAYYTYHLTYDPPSDFAFAAMGLRDSQPWKHRIRSLALEGQIHESDVGNPDLALTGRFDFTFHISLLAPLLVIMLLYDLRSGEKSAGRLELLEASAGSGQRLWMHRTILRIALLALMVLAPLWIGTIMSGTSLGIIVKASFITCAYLAFWGALCLWLAGSKHTGARNLTVLIGLWLFICAVLPAFTSELSTRLVTVPEGGDIIMTQREAVNDAWDLPKDTTMMPFLERHPDYADYSQIEKPFEWKWYFAFHQVGDQKAEALSQAYTDGRQKRETYARKLSLLSPASYIQRSYETLAKTDTNAALVYETNIRNFHKKLRMYYYPRLFKDMEFSTEDSDTRPQF